MSPSKIFIVLFLIIAADLTGACADEIAGFDGLYWRMTKEQVEKTYPNFQEWSEEAFATDPLTLQETNKKTLIRRYGLKEYYILGCRTVFYLDFIENELESLSFRHIVSENDDCADRFKEGLNSKYVLSTNPSNKNFSDKFPTVETIEWKKNNTKVNLTISLNRYSSGGDIFLHYSNIGALEKWLLKQIDKSKM